MAKQQRPLLTTDYKTLIMENNAKPLYEDIYELLKFRGIKQGKVAQVMKMSYNNWYKSRKNNLRTVTIDEIAQLARFLELPTEQVFLLCHAFYKRARQKQQMDSADEPTEPADGDQSKQATMHNDEP